MQDARCRIHWLRWARPPRYTFSPPSHAEHSSRDAGRITNNKQPTTNNQLTKRSGFSLIELLVVVAIISILATFIALNVGRVPDKARIAKARAEIEILRTGLNVYRLEQGRYPEQGQGLVALRQKPTTEPIPARYPAGGYIEKLRPDPWGNPYVYLIPGSDGEKFEIISYGADGEPGGVEERTDISSSDL